jgi:hypothetical protein
MYPPALYAEFPTLLPLYSFTADTNPLMAEI